ncbi:MAG TPA: hypothetical protein VHZ96_26365 [Frankiaceae bacterium]|jgi:hypothetical protein|nr:hypothetical protein [Frankiaceae bacterium]
MTAPVELDAATRAELAIPCEEHVARPLADPCPDPAAWIATFTLDGAAPMYALLCDRHTVGWQEHMAACSICGRFARLDVQRLDRKGSRT